MIDPEAGATAEVSVEYLYGSAWIRVEWNGDRPGLHTPPEAYDLAQSIRESGENAPTEGIARQCKQTATELLRAAHEVAVEP